MPTRPTPIQRLGLLLLALALPALMLVVSLACLMAVTRLGNHDRVLFWVEGSPAQLAALEASVRQHPVFRHGRVAPGAFESHRPDSCPASMYSASFSRLHDYERMLAKETLDELVAASGARRCQAHGFIFNDLPNLFDPSEWNDSIASLLLVLLIPLGTLGVAYWACGRQFALPHPLRGGRAPLRTTLSGLGTAGLGLAWAAGVAWAWPRVTGQPLGTTPLPSLTAGLLLVVSVYAPILEEVAFRGWLVPIAERALGTLGAGGLSALAFAAVHLPGSPGAAVMHLGLGLMLAGLFLRTRSVLACVIAHGAYNAGAFHWQWLVLN